MKKSKFGDQSIKAESLNELLAYLIKLFVQTRDSFVKA